MEMKATWKILCIFVILLGVTCHDDGRWRKANRSPVCFGAKDSQYGRFYAPNTGKLAAVKLVHLYGYVSCEASGVSHMSFWGCSDNVKEDSVNVAITTSSNDVLLPPGLFQDALGWSKIPGYDGNSPTLVLSSLFAPPEFSVHVNQELRLWYGEDLKNNGEGDNKGRACCDVYTMIMII